MTSIRMSSSRAACVGIVLLGGLATAWWIFPRPNVHGQDGAGKATLFSAREQLNADLDIAIKLVEDGDFVAFLDRYAPADQLRRMRVENVVERAAKALGSKSKIKAQLVTTFKALKEQTPKFDKSRNMATIEFDPVANGLEESAPELQLPSTQGLELTGLGGDLKSVLAAASKLLDAGEHEAFVLKLFPASELARLQAPGALQDLVEQLKTPSSPVGPNLTAALTADLRSLQGMSPEMTEGGTVATYKTKAKPGQPSRTIKFQKKGSDWRFFDNAEAVVAELARQSNLKARSATTAVAMERIGGNWRFIELPNVFDDGNRPGAFAAPAQPPAFFAPPEPPKRAFPQSAPKAAPPIDRFDAPKE